MIARPRGGVVCHAAAALLWLLASAVAAADRPAVVVTGVDADAAALAAVAREHGLEVLAGYTLQALDAAAVTLAVPRGADVEAWSRRLARDPRVATAQPRRRHRVAGMPPKDPYYELQRRTFQGGVATIVQRGHGLNVRIAILDTGVDLAHPDLRGQVLEARNFVGAAADAMPAEFHGTAVAGLIAARAGNGIGIHGLADQAQVYALRACWEPTYGYGVCSTDTLAQALDYAIEIRARIVNLSLAGPDDPLLARLVERALELGAVVFGAIGEEPGFDFPTAIPGVIAVEQNRRGEIQVPGERLTIPGQQLLTTVPGGRYDFVSGPSFATAHASGVAAILLEREPLLQTADLADWLRRLHDAE